MKYKVLIPTAGTGSRLSHETKYINKSLVLVNNKPVISHIVDKFPINTEFVIALGYKGNLVKQYLKIAHPKNRFQFVWVSKFKGNGSGLGLSIYECKNFLKSPFIFFSCDAYVENKIIPKPDKNWVGYSKSYSPKLYRTLKIKKKRLISILEKNSKNGKFNYVGIAGIYDFNKFWKAIKKNKKIINEGEVAGINKIINQKVRIFNFKWSDCGSIKSLNNLRKRLKLDVAQNILPKDNEFISFVDGKVIKFHVDRNFIQKRVLRQKILKKFTPKILDYSENFYAYKKIQGEIFSKKNNKENFQKLIIFLQNFWAEKKLSSKEKKTFSKTCLKFYRNKTLERIDQFYRKNNYKDKKTKINGKFVPKIKDLFKMIDWKKLSVGVPVNFHGDLHFENIIINSKKIKLLDWRQDFGSSLNYGDIYYDFAKLLHGMIVSHDIVLKNQFEVIKEKNNIHIKIRKKLNNLVSIKLFEKWVKLKNYNFKKIKIICGLVYLNIAALHHNPYSIFLFYLGKLMIYNTLNNEKTI